MSGRMPESVAIAIREPSQVGEARRVASAMAAGLGLDETSQGRAALVATELATNLVRHAREGTLILSCHRSGPSAVEFLAVDHGPGLADFRRCLADGYTTRSTPGTGLGAVGRAAIAFDADSEPGRGTIVAARVADAPSPLHPPTPRPFAGFDVGAVCLPMAGESACGDAWGLVEAASGAVARLMIADGLGHGPHAARASTAAIAVLHDQPRLAPADLIHAAHRALKGTRGAAVAVASIDRDRREVRFAGVGNIAATILAPDARIGLVAHNGTVGLDVRKVQELVYPWPEHALWIGHSDGLASHWGLDRRSPLASRLPAVIAGALYRDHARARDDATVVVVRDRPGGEP